jgi:hypothetical protein
MNRGTGTFHVEAITEALQSYPIIKLNRIFAMTNSIQNIPEKTLANTSSIVRTGIGISSPNIPET